MECIDRGIECKERGMRACMVLKEFKRRGVGDVCCCDCRKRAEAEGSVLIHMCITKKRDICIAAFHDYFDAYVVANVVHNIPI